MSKVERGKLLMTFYKLSGRPFCPFDSLVYILNESSISSSNRLPEDIYESDNVHITREKTGQTHLDYHFLDRVAHTLRVFTVSCTRKCYALLIADCVTNVRIWINGVLRGMFRGSKKMLVLSMDQGDNIIGLEIEETTPETDMFLRISDYELEKQNFLNPISCCFSFDGNMGYLKQCGQHLYENEPFCFSFSPNNDMLEKDNFVEVCLYNNFTKETLYKNSIPIKQEFALDISTYEIDDYDDGNGLVAEIKYNYSNGAVYSSILPLYTKPLDVRLKKITERADNIKKMYNLSDYDRLCIDFGVEYITKYGRELPPILSQAALLRGSLDRIESCGHVDNSFYNAGDRRIFFFNNLYKAVNYYRILVPQNYDPNHKYPLLVIFSTIEYGDWCKRFKKYTKEAVIVADVSGRGVLLGSYMGDASIQLALEDIFSKYSIDRSRVYCSGNSNGAGTSWAQAALYPNVYAGIYAVSGQPNYDLLINLNNQRIIALSSEADDMYSVFVKTKGMLREHRDFNGIVAEGYSHQALHHLWFNECIFEKLFESRSDPYPNHIAFCTLSNRHREAYWVTIHSISPGAIVSKIIVDIVDCDVSVCCDGITGFSFCIPPQLSNRQFKVFVNGKVASVVEGREGESVHFVNVLSNDEETEKYVRVNSYAPIKNLYHGFGLLDVYLDPLSVVIPLNSTKEVCAVAAAFAEPYCNGFIPKVYVSYPVVSFNQMEESDECETRSMIVIDDFSFDDHFISLIRRSAPIQTNKEGWLYEGEWHDENYCIQQIFESPWNPQYSIVLISTNDVSLFYKNLFTRKVVIPTYASGHHDFLNSNAIVFNGKYFVIPDWRMRKIIEM